MAAHMNRQNGGRSLLSEVNSIEQQMPNGSCNFKDLSSGARAPTCGCRKFWLNVQTIHGHDHTSERAWCFCGHHACFHNTTRQSPVQSAMIRQSGGTRSATQFGAVNVDGRNIWQQEMVGESRQQNDGFGNVGLEHAQGSQRQQPAGLGLQLGSSTQSINERVFRDLTAFARRQEEADASDTTSKLPSTAAPSVAGELYAPPKRMFVDGAIQPMRPPVNIPSAYHVRQNGEDYIASATEVATPSIAGTPDLRAFAPPSAQRNASPGRTHLMPARQPGTHLSPQHPGQDPASIRQSATGNAGVGQAGHSEAAASGSNTTSPLELQNIIQGYARRLDILENLSFAHVPAEEIQEQFSLVDARLLDLESWRVDQEREAANEDIRPQSGHKRRRLLPSESSSFASDGSFDSNAAAHAETIVLATIAANEETGPRIDALESRVAELEEASLPSFSRPWQVEVVLLPWGRELRGIWFSASDASQHASTQATVSNEEWTGMQSSTKGSFLASKDENTLAGGWTTDSIQAWANDATEWLSPKACGPNGAVYKRLISRGLVKTVTLTRPDAQHVLESISTAFAEAEVTSSHEEPSANNAFHALKERFIPLRKVRKSSRLRFLCPAEMITPATWTADFLDAGVIMKVQDGRRRLYVTTPEAYVQTDGVGWSWPRLKQLPHIAIRDEHQNAQDVNGDISDHCWDYNEKLDLVASKPSSFASQATHESQWSTRSQVSVHSKPSNRPISPLSEARPVRQRTASLPSSNSASEQARASLPKRRVASFEQTSTVPLDSAQAYELMTAKRRRISISPELERRGVNFTPRWSREPPSPFTSDNLGEGRSQGTAGRKRGTTPFAYATPHSNSNYIGRMDFSGCDGDTEADTEIAAPAATAPEEEWEGVEDGTGSGSAALGDHGDESDIDELEGDEDNLDEGLTIYET